METGCGVTKKGVIAYAAHFGPEDDGLGTYFAPYGHSERVVAGTRIAVHLGLAQIHALTISENRKLPSDSRGDEPSRAHVSLSDASGTRFSTVVDMPARDDFGNPWSRGDGGSPSPSAGQRTKRDAHYRLPTGLEVGPEAKLRITLETPGLVPQTMVVDVFN